MSDEIFVDCRHGDGRRRSRLRLAPAGVVAVFAPFSTVYREAWRTENAVAPGFWLIGRQEHR
jgi:hypothetical protein